MLLQVFQACGAVFMLAFPPPPSHKKIFFTILGDFRHFRICITAGFPGLGRCVYFVISNRPPSHTKIFFFLSKFLAILGDFGHF